MNFHWRLESRRNPQAGKPALRRTDILASEFRPRGNLKPLRRLDDPVSSRTEPLCEHTESLRGRTRPLCGRNESLRSEDESLCVRASPFFRQNGPGDQS